MPARILVVDDQRANVEMMATVIIDQIRAAMRKPPVTLGFRTAATASFALFRVKALDVVF